MNKKQIKDKEAFKRLLGMKGEENDLLKKILELRQQIKDNEAKIELKKEEAKKFFKKRYQNFKVMNQKYNVQYDLIQAAMFGNNTVL